MEQTFLDRPIVAKKVTYEVTDTRNPENDKYYEVSSEDCHEGSVFVYTNTGDGIKIPIEDVPLLINALTDFIK